MLIQVSQEDIDRARKFRVKNPPPLWCTTCPISLALFRVFNRFVYVVSGSFSFAGRHVHKYEYSLPLSTTNFIVDFDNGKPLEPFQFEIEPIASNGIKTQSKDSLPKRSPQ